MQILAFETSAKAVSVALVEDGALIGEYFQNSGQTHSRTLMQMAEDLLRNCDRTVADVDAVACAAGPGSFTGVRIGAAAAKGFAWGRELPCYGVSTLEAMIRAAAWADGIYCAAMDARRNQVYTALFSLRQGVFTRLMEDSAISLEALKEKLLAAYRAGVTDILLPRENERDLEKIDADIRAKLRITLLDNIDDAVALVLPQPREMKVAV